MNLQVKVDRNGSLYVCDEEGNISENIEKIEATSRVESGLIETTYKITITDAFGKIEI